MDRLRLSGPWQFFAVLPRADRGLAALWWTVLGLRSVLPAVLAVGTGALVGAVTRHTSLTAPLVTVGIAFVLLQTLPAVHTALSLNLGSRVSAHLFDRLAELTTAPKGIGHLEDPALAADLTTAREFDRGMTGPPMYLNVDFIAGSLTMLVAGVISALTLVRYVWWAPVVLLVGWGSTHWLLRESGVWKDRNTDEVKQAQQHAEYAFRLAVSPPPAKEVRLFGLEDWVLDRFATVRRHLFTLQYEATRLRERSVLGALAITGAANLAVFLWLARAATSDGMPLGTVVTAAQLALGVSAVAFGGLNWAMDGAAAPVVAIGRLSSMVSRAGALLPGTGQVLPAASSGRPGVALTIRDLHFTYPRTDRPIYAGLDLDIRPGEALAVVGVNGAGKTTLAKLLCRFYDPVAGTISADGTDLRDLDVDQWRASVTAVFQDFLRLDLSLRDNVDPGRRASDEQVLAALSSAGADHLASLETPLAKGYPGGTDLSGGQWQRVALARALCAVTTGSRLVLLDEPTAGLDVRGEAVIFQRLLDATRGATRILVSHRFSTVRMADRIAVLEDGRVTEIGTHDELIERHGRYAEMFGLQASRFDATDDEGVSYELLD